LGLPISSQGHTGFRDELRDSLRKNPISVTGETKSLFQHYLRGSSLFLGMIPELGNVGLTDRVPIAIIDI